MPRTPLLTLLLSLALAAAACSSAPPTPPDAPVSPDATATPDPGARGAAAEEANCQVLDPNANPPTCSEGCIWDPAKSKCKDNRGVIVEQ